MPENILDAKMYKKTLKCVQYIVRRSATDQFLPWRIDNLMKTEIIIIIEQLSLEIFIRR